MNNITASELNQKIQLLPTNLLSEVEKYVDFLTFKSSHSDWASQLSKYQISLIEKAKKDIEQNSLISHKEAKEKIKNYIKSKSV